MAIEMLTDKAEIEKALRETVGRFVTIHTHEKEYAFLAVKVVCIEEADDPVFVVAAAGVAETPCVLSSIRSCDVALYPRTRGK